MPSYSRHLNMDFCSCEARLFFITMIFFSSIPSDSVQQYQFENYLNHRCCLTKIRNIQHVFGVQLKLLDPWWYLGAILSNKHGMGDCQVTGFGQTCHGIYLGPHSLIFYINRTRRSDYFQNERSANRTLKKKANPALSSSLPDSTCLHVMFHPNNTRMKNRNATGNRSSRQKANIWHGRR